MSAMHMSRSEVRQQNLEKLDRATATLEQITTQPGVPRNVRTLIRDVLTSLKDEKVALGLRVVNAISTLDSTSQDPGLPSFARVEIWSAVSQLESIRE